MNKLLQVTLICAVALQVAAQESNAGTAAAIRALEKQWLIAQAHNDNRALDLIFDNALVYVEYGDLVSKGEYLNRIRAEAPNLSQVEMGPSTVHLFGNTAIVVGSYSEKRLGSPRHVKRWRFIDTWVYKKNGWMLVAAGATPVSN